MVLVFVSLAILTLLIFCGLWIGFSIGIGGLASLSPALGLKVFYLIGLMAWQTSFNWVLIAVPLFVFMGNIIASSGMADILYGGMSKLIGGLPGRLVQSNIAACTIFAACSGSSLAGAATMGRLAYTEQVINRGYRADYVCGSVAAGGTLSVLIPPSIAFIIYGALTDQSVGRLFMGGVVPGLILAILFMIYVGLKATIDKSVVPAEARLKVTFKERILGLMSITPLLGLSAVVLGSIYAGIATPTEAAAVGVVGAVLLGLVLRRVLRRGKVDFLRSLWQAAKNTIVITSAILFVIIAALFFSNAVTYYNLPPIFREFAMSLQSPWILLTMVGILYLILGMFFDALSMMVLTVPFVVPAMEAAGFDLVWFGVIFVILQEVGELTPPVGLNLFVIQGVTGEDLWTVARGSLPYVVMHLFGVALFTIFPQFVLWLPNRVYG